MMNTLHELNTKYPGKTAFITGAGSGLGASFAKLLSVNGWNLHLSDIELASLDEVKSQMEGSGSVYLYSLDVSSKIGFEKVVEEVRKNTNKIDLLINNAGIGDGELFQNYKIDHWERMIHVNLMGVYYGTHYLLPFLLDNGSGLIVNIGSAAGFMNAPGMSAYNVSKAGVYAFSETLYHELKSKKIHVSVVTPTFFRTNIMSQAHGSEVLIHFAEKQMQHSTTNAEEMASIVLTKSAKGMFQILHPKEARKGYFFKKWFPGLVSKQFEKMMIRFSR